MTYMPTRWHDLRTLSATISIVYIREDLKFYRKNYFLIWSTLKITRIFLLSPEVKWHIYALNPARCQIISSVCYIVSFRNIDINWHPRHKTVVETALLIYSPEQPSNRQLRLSSPAVRKDDNIFLCMCLFQRVKNGFEITLIVLLRKGVNIFACF